jgi:hypothetical protein
VNLSNMRALLAGRPAGNGLSAPFRVTSMLSAEANYLLGIRVPIPEPVRRWRTDGSS